MPRRKPRSAKQHKAELQVKRAIKRGDVEEPPKQQPQRQKKSGKQAAAKSAATQSVTATRATEASRRLGSSFVKLSPEFLARSKELADQLPLTRPIPPEAAIYKDERYDEQEGTKEGTLTCPRRPKWRYEMSKQEVEKNEEALFGKWIMQIDGEVERWLSEKEAESEDSGSAAMPSSPTWFERNLEVWRQLWRVTELSQIILILLDTRFPLLHFPSSLQYYLAHYTSENTPRSKAKKLILILTKTDLCGKDRADAWERYLRGRFSIDVVQVESYAGEGDVKAEGGAAKSALKGKQRAHKPKLPSSAKLRLIETLKAAHEQLLEAPERIRKDEEKLRKWVPTVKRKVDWERLLAEGLLPRRGGHVEAGEGEGAEELGPVYLTVGLIGQPNVGKSSLLNALFGITKVRASKTPGKTKHFQTLFWSEDVRLVDCPGLVMPSFVPMEIQVLSGILPIPRVPSIPSCIYNIANLLPLERILDLPHPSATQAQPEVEDKRTWREGQSRPVTESRKGGEARWTAMELLNAYAEKRGWVTAKAGRPDGMRAGNFVLRMLAEGRIRWAFWPPGTNVEVIRGGQKEDGAGIWIEEVGGGGTVVSGELCESDEEQGGSEAEAGEETSSGEEEGLGKVERRVRWSIPSGTSDEDDGEEEEEGEVKVASLGRFGALALVNEGESDEEEPSDDG